MVIRLAIAQISTYHKVLKNVGTQCPKCNSNNKIQNFHINIEIVHHVKFHEWNLINSFFWHLKAKGNYKGTKELDFVLMCLVFQFHHVYSYLEFASNQFILNIAQYFLFAFLLQLHDNEHDNEHMKTPTHTKGQIPKQHLSTYYDWNGFWYTKNFLALNIRYFIVISLVW
jgi:hypothetical protein